LIDGTLGVCEQFCVVASALLKIAELITIQNVDHKLPLTALRGGRGQ